MDALGMERRVPVQNLRQRARFARRPGSLRSAPGAGGDCRGDSRGLRRGSESGRWVAGQRGDRCDEVTQRPGFEQRLLLQGNAERRLEPGDELDQGQAVEPQIPVQHAVRGDSHLSLRRQLLEKPADGRGDHLRPPIVARTAAGRVRS